MINDELYRLALDAVRDPLVVADRNGVILLANAAAHNAFDVDSARSVSGLRWTDDDLVIDGVELRRLMTQYESVRDFRLQGADGQESGTTLDIESARRADGEQVKLLHFHSPAPSPHGEMWRDEMISMVSHELKNPLSAMKHSVDILLSEEPGDLTDGQRRFLGTSGRSIERLTRLVDGFLDVSRIHSGAMGLERERTNVREFLSDVVGHFTELFNVRNVGVNWDVDSGVGVAWLDAPKLEQVLVNLMSNALKHTPEGGAITVKVRAVGAEALPEDDRLLPWSELGAPRLLELSVRDNGLGMSTETLDAAFERYHDDGVKGRGHHLGLSISRTLVEAQGGWMKLESELGVGTTATVCVPQDRTTGCLLERFRAAHERVDDLVRCRRSSVVFAIGKATDEDWADIAATWNSPPAVNPSATNDPSVHSLWTINEGLAIAVVADAGDGEHENFAAAFNERFVLRMDGTAVFDGYGVGACRQPAEAETFTRMCTVATQRMMVALDAATQARDTDVESPETNPQFVVHEWAKSP